MDMRNGSTRHLGSPGAAAGLDGRELERRRRPVHLPGHRPGRHEQHLHALLGGRHRHDGHLAARHAGRCADLGAGCEHRRLLRWDGSAWAPGDGEGSTPLTDAQFRFDGGRNGGQTDLYLPFELLGIPAGASLGLLAFAAEEPTPDIGLRVWATLPVVNPVNSGRVNTRLPLAPIGSTMALRHAYRWAALGDGVCPNGTNGTLLEEQHSDAALRTDGRERPARRSHQRRSRRPVLGGQPGLRPRHVRPRVAVRLPAIRRTRRCRTARRSPTRCTTGTRAATPWKAPGWTLSAIGALQLDRDRLDLGDIPPGGRGDRHVRGHGGPEPVAARSGSGAGPAACRHQRD